jgi:hypothetical protein
MKERAIDRSIPMVIFMTLVIAAGLVAAGRDEKAADRIRHWLAGDGHAVVIRSR